MIIVSQTILFWTVAIIQIAGVLSLGLARASQGSPRYQQCQLCFYVCLTLVGAAAMLCLQCRDGGWLLCAITLSVMAVGATMDCSGAAQRTARPLQRLS